MPVAAARYRTANRRAHGLSLRLSPTAAANRDGKNKCRVEVLFGFLWVEWILVVFRRATKIQAAPLSSKSQRLPRFDFCGLRRVCLFVHALLSSVELAEHRRSPARG